MVLSAPVRGVVEGGLQAVLGRCFRGGRGVGRVGYQKGPGTDGLRFGRLVVVILTRWGVPPLSRGQSLCSWTTTKYYESPYHRGIFPVAVPRQLINRRFQQVLQIGNWRVRSAERADFGVVGGPSQLGVSINKGRPRDRFRGPLLRSGPPLLWGVSPRSWSATTNY